MYLKSAFKIETIIPAKQYLEQAHHYVSDELTQGIFSVKAKSFFLNQMELLKQRGAEGIILGCTELPLLLKDEDFDIPLLATTDLHAKMITEFILE